MVQQPVYAEQKKRRTRNNAHPLIRQKTALTNEKVREIAESIRYSYMDRKRILITVFGSYEERTYNGIVENLDQNHNRLNLGGQWIFFHDIIDVSCIDP
ncbi:YolD-like family protein [Paenibacillus methanolicus]|uniref:YolD-like protein n=1 Tax=Paenibacillus methanolicus TaxID=582686 RepID=A0A5S5CBL2_9BACL|nr:YolD-like family protein [Paenibacillus methanolicus]TYP76744.1 YolD-like protein [Paenibacillus methanolicus]